MYLDLAFDANLFYQISIEFSKQLSRQVNQRLTVLDSGKNLNEMRSFRALEDNQTTLGRF